MRLTLIICLLALASCADTSKGRVQCDHSNDPARRAQYPALKDAQYDSLAVANHWTCTPP